MMTTIATKKVIAHRCPGDLKIQDVDSMSNKSKERRLEVADLIRRVEALSNHRKQIAEDAKADGLLKKTGSKPVVGEGSGSSDVESRMSNPIRCRIKRRHMTDRKRGS